ncbi:MAG: hypothetical protein HY903_02420 [Deltaproteobacteria bacterium]|nr:hypothetical protein [Deltaproteobacteria bacterium]
MSNISGPGSTRPGRTPATPATARPAAPPAATTRPGAPTVGLQKAPARAPTGVVGQTPTDGITVEKRSTAAKEAAPAATSKAIGAVQIGGQETVPQLGALVAKAGAVTGAAVAERGDVDINLLGGGLFSLSPSSMASIGRGLAHIFKTGDVDAQRRAGLLLRAVADAAKVELHGVKPPRKQGEIPAPAARAATLDSLENLVSPRTAKIWTGIEAAFVELNARTLSSLKGRKPAAGAVNPDYDGTAAYGGGPASWISVAGYELWDFDGINADRVLQNSLGDCFLLSALAAVALKDPQAIEKMVAYNAAKGVYEVSFYAVAPLPGGEQGELQLVQPLEKVIIEVDPSVLVDATGQSVGAGVIDADQDGLPAIGINLIEKAFAIYNDQLRAQYPGQAMFGLGAGGGYNGINTGYPDMALLALTGKATSWDLVPATAVDLWDTMSAANTGEAVILGAKADLDMSATGIVPGHAYTVLGTCVVDGVEYVCLRNPWGEVEPKSAAGTVGANGANDGVFLLPKSEIDKYFSAVYFDADAPGIGASAQLGEYTNVGAALQTYVAIASTHGADVGQLDGKAAGALFGGFSGGAGSNIHYDPNAIVQAVLRESYMQTTYDLAYQAEKVRYYNEVKKAIREQLSAFNKINASLAGISDDEAGNYDLAGNAVAGEDGLDGIGGLGSGAAKNNFLITSAEDRLANYPAQHQKIAAFEPYLQGTASQSLSAYLLGDENASASRISQLVAVIPFMTPDELKKLFDQLGQNLSLAPTDAKYTALVNKLVGAMTKAQFFAVTGGQTAADAIQAQQANKPTQAAGKPGAASGQPTTSGTKPAQGAGKPPDASQKQAVAGWPSCYNDCVSCITQEHVENAVSVVANTGPSVTYNGYTVTGSAVGLTASNGETSLLLTSLGGAIDVTQPPAHPEGGPTGPSIVSEALFARAATEKAWLETELGVSFAGKTWGEVVTAYYEWRATSDTATPNTTGNVGGATGGGPLGNPNFYIASAEERISDYPAKHTQLAALKPYLEGTSAKTLSAVLVEEAAANSSATLNKIVALVPYMTKDELAKLVGAVMKDVDPAHAAEWCEAIVEAMTPRQYLEAGPLMTAIAAVVSPSYHAKFDDAFNARKAEIVAQAEIATGKSLSGKTLEQVKTAWIEAYDKKELASAADGADLLALALKGTAGAKDKLLAAIPGLSPEEVLAMFTAACKDPLVAKNANLMMDVLRALSPRQLVEAFDAIHALPWGEATATRKAIETAYTVAVDALEAETGKSLDGKTASAILAEVGKASTGSGDPTAAGDTTTATEPPAGGSPTSTAPATPAIDTDASDGSVDAVALTDAPPFIAATGEKIRTKAQLEAAIKELEEQLNSVGDDAQLANVDLQNTLQKQQQTLQMMSNISKMLHDTALAIIRKIGG